MRELLFRRDKIKNFLVCECGGWEEGARAADIFLHSQGFLELLDS
jgi:hypothetical protein